MKYYLDLLAWEGVRRWLWSTENLMHYWLKISAFQEGDLEDGMLDVVLITNQCISGRQQGYNEMIWKVNRDYMSHLNDFSLFFGAQASLFLSSGQSDRKFWTTITESRLELE